MASAQLFEVSSNCILINMLAAIMSWRRFVNMRAFF
jgi:hypothetical protein